LPYSADLPNRAAESLSGEAGYEPIQVRSRSQACCAGLSFFKHA